MSVLVFLEIDGNNIKNSSKDAVACGAELAERLGTSIVAAAIGECSTESLAKVGGYGAEKIIHSNNSRILSSPQACTEAITQMVEKEKAEIILFASSSLADSFASRVGARLKAAVASNVTEIPDVSSGFKVKRSIYTGKAFEEAELKTDKKIILLKKNAFTGTDSGGTAPVEEITVNIPEEYFGIQVKETQKAEGEIQLPDADVVVSGGRGMKGPENWGLIEDLAKTLGAATACSKPVSDMDWRPHHEHVGQTGVKISPNLYIAVGISGAVQHLAGVNSSKVIVAINKDADAPFFKAADYGIVGDAFEVLPKLTEAFKKAL